MKSRLLLSLALAAAVAGAHPMGNFSVSHYTRLDVSAKGVEVTYVLDLAEVPTYTLLRDWKLDAKSPQADLDLKAAAQAKEWEQGLEFHAAGKPVEPRLVHATIKIGDGAGGLSVARITSTFELPGVKAPLTFEDRNFPERAGWKEIVIGSVPASAAGVEMLSASQASADRSKALTEYPADPTLAPPQDLRASVDWRLTGAAISQSAPPRVVPIEQPKPVAAPAVPPPSSTPQVRQPPGSVVKGDFLSRLLAKDRIGWQWLLLGLVVAFGIGGAHALEPGHGKTIVAAYLVGSRGTMKHAAILGAMVTFTHTISVFLLGLAMLLLSKSIVPDKVIRVLEAVSGLSIVVIGAIMLVQRLRRLRSGESGHHHGHTHDHDHTHGPADAHTHQHDHHAQADAHGNEHSHDHAQHAHADAAGHTHAHVHVAGHTHDRADGHTHEHEHADAHTHDHGHAHAHAHVHAAGDGHDHAHSHDHGHGHDHDHAPSHTRDHSHAHDHDHTHDHGHDHGPHGHSHVPEGEITLGSLVALGISGGLVPCPAALVIMLAAIAFGHVGVGLVLLVAFSLGLAGVLMAVGMMVLYARSWFPDPSAAGRHPIFRLVPVISAIIIMCLGLLMTGVSLGWVRPGLSV